MKYIRTLMIFCAAMPVIGCASKQIEVHPLAMIGAESFGGGEAYVTVEIPAEEEQPFVLRRNSPSSRRLAALIAPAERRVVRLVVGGPSSETTRDAIIKAFEGYRGKTLGGLEMIFVGNPEDARAVAIAAQPLLAVVRFHAAEIPSAY